MATHHNVEQICHKLVSLGNFAWKQTDYTQ